MGYNNPNLITRLDIDPAIAERNALLNQQYRQTNQLRTTEMAQAPAERNYLLGQRAQAQEQIDYDRGRRPTAELGQEADILKKILPTLSYESYLQMLPKLQQDLPNLGPTLPDREAWEAKAAEAGMTAEEFFEQSRPGAKTEADKAKWSAPREGMDDEGNPIVYRVSDTGQAQIVKGVKPKPGKGMKIYDREGNLIVDTGGGEGPELTKKTIGKIEGKVIDGSEQLARMNNIYSEYKPEYQEVGTRFKAAWTGTKAFLGIGVEEKDRTLLTEFKGFQRKAIENINLYIKELTGAQMSEKEADRLRLAQPDPGEKWYNGDDPITFKAKMDDVLKTTRAAVARWKYYKSKQYTDDQIKALINKGDAMNLNDLANRMK